MIAARVVQTVSVVLVVGLAVAVPHNAPAQTDPYVGTWKLNVEKSEFTGPPPKEMIITVEADAHGLTS
jgi:hypothetical protein